MKFPSRFLIGVAGTVTAGLLPTPSVQASSFGLQFLGQSIFSTGFIPAGSAGTVNGIPAPVGGLSGLTYDPATNNFYMISDDRSQNAPARFYTAMIEPTLFNQNGTNNGVTFTGVTALLQANGQTFPALSLDPEGIALVGSNLYISSEGEVSNSRVLDPFVNRFALANGQQNNILPIPSQFIPAPRSILATSGVRNNLALESLTTTPDQRFLFTASENALVQDGPFATLTNGSPSRIVQYDLGSGQAIAQYLYNTAPVALPPNPSTPFNTNGLVDLLALDNSGKRFLSLERSVSPGATGTPGNTGNTVKIYAVSLDGATDISGFSSINGVSGIVPATKTLLLDLTSLNIPIDNVEGISFGPDLPNGKRSLILVSDNNFSPAQFTQFLAFSVETVPEPSTIAGLLAIGCGGFLVKRGRSR
jgi:hypothetical protein